MSETSDNAIVSSSHLVSLQRPELSEFEYGLTIVNNAFLRWMQHCAKAAGVSELGVLDIQVIHHVAHRDRAKNLADICFVLNLEDSHNVAYSLRKLVKQGLLSSERRGKETYYQPSRSGWQFCREYKSVRERCLIESLKDLKLSDRQLSDIAGALRTLSGFYDQASRSAASF